jgi:diacylglycerol kinase
MNASQFLKSFRYALRGINYLYAHEQNIRIQTAFAIVVIFFGYLFQLNRLEWIVIFFLIMLVLILEIVNSVIERFIDIVKPRLHIQVQVIKDMLAAMVLFAAGSAMIIGMIIFWPHVMEFLPFY